MQQPVSPHHFARWKYYFLFIALVLAFIYAIPNFYGEDPAVQISGLKGQIIDADRVQKLERQLQTASIQPKSVVLENNQKELLVRLPNPEAQLRAKEIIRKEFDENYSVALNLAPVTPAWLVALGAKPMKLGLDLQGGVHFLMQVDVASVVNRRLEGYYIDLPKVLRQENLSYKNIDQIGKEKISISFKDKEAQDKAYRFLKTYASELVFIATEESEVFSLTGEFSDVALQAIRSETLEQTMATLRNRVNELGVAEAIVQRQGLNRVVVELPGIQDTAYARDILGKTATLKFLMEDYKHELKDVLAGNSVAGSKIYIDRHRRPVLLRTQPIMTGEAVVGATTAQDRDGGPSVSVRLGGDVAFFSKITRENIGRRMAVVYIEINEGKINESLISLATIQSALGNQFQITGLTYEESRDLALLLRAGALPAPVSIVEESIVGPSMGQENIQMGIISVAVGLGLVLVFMTFYYSVFGVIANLALLANLIFLLALMSLIGATLTLPGIAGIVLTLGMAVDANVLIFERIREELRLGLSPKNSIHRGFQYAFATIIDSNLTTLIVGVILFSVGTGPVKGFAVTLCIGILTSLLTATMGSRALVELLYGGRNIKRIRVGI